MSKPRACGLHAIIPPRNGEGGAEPRVGLPSHAGLGLRSGGQALQSVMDDGLDDAIEVAKDLLVPEAQS